MIIGWEVDKNLGLKLFDKFGQLDVGVSTKVEYTKLTIREIICKEFDNIYGNRGWYDSINENLQKHNYTLRVQVVPTGMHELGSDGIEICLYFLGVRVLGRYGINQYKGICEDVYQNLCHDAERMEFINKQDIHITTLVSRDDFK